jgi:ABC-2 type transport system permease protein
MNKISIIIQREYVTRVRKKSFLILSIIGPLLFACITFLPALIMSSKNENQRIVVVDDTKSFCGILESNTTVHYDYGYCTVGLSEVKKIFADSAHASVLYIPKSDQIQQVQLFSKDDPGIDVISAIEDQLNTIFEKAKMKENNLDETTIAKVKSNITVQDIVGNAETHSGYNMALGYGCAFFTYLFIFLYSMQVMRGVMEEKTNRIVEVIISSVRPFQLMTGKVIGVGLVGLTQFLIWVILGCGVYFTGSAYLQNQEINPKNAVTAQTYKTGMPVHDYNQVLGGAGAKIVKGDKTQYFDKVDNMLRATNWVLVIGCVLFYFLGGYLLYSAFFAAVGSAVDQDATDNQQFMLPVTAPLTLCIIVLGGIITNPHGSMAVWLSIIPFTSPITMMARIPFGVPIWQLVLSMVLLLGSIFGAIWLAGRIYRVGLLMYGKKVTYRELGKWIFYK